MRPKTKTFSWDVEPDPRRCALCGCIDRNHRRAKGRLLACEVCSCLGFTSRKDLER